MAKDVPMKKRETGLSARPHELVSEKPWDGSAARFTNAQWKRSCILHVCDGDEKSCHKLPIREPGGALSRAGVHAAAARISQVDATAEQVESAKRALRGAYKKLGEEPPSSALSASVSTPKTGPAKRRRPSFLTPRVNRQLQLRVDEHNKTFKSREQRANITMLRAVYRRGADEHRARDYSHVSREQFGLERVDQFLKLLRGDTADNPRYFQDGDLLPRRHPRLTGAKITASGESQARGPQLAFVASAAAAQQDHVLLDFVTAIATTPPTSPTRQFDLNRALVYADTRPYLLAAAEELRALVADGNSRAARSARARRQLRDRKGRWIEMGGGIRWKLRLPGFGTRISHGTVVGQNVATGKVQARLDDGRVVDVPANKVESVKATLPSAEILKSRRAADTRTSADSAAREAFDRVGRAIFGEAYTGDRDMDLYDAADAEITRVNGDTSGRASVVIDGNRGRVDRADLDAIIKGVESDRSQTPEQAIARIRSTEVPSTPDEEMDADAPVLDENEVTPARAVARLPEPAGLDEINNTAGDIIKELSEQIARQPGETLSDARDGFAERFLDIADAFNEPDATVADTQSDLDRLIDDVQAFVTANDDSSNEYQVLKNFAEDVDDFKAIVGLADRGATPAEADVAEEAAPELQPLLQSMANQLRDLDGDYETASEQLADLADEIATGQVTPADAVERAAEIVESPEFPGNNNPDVSKRDAAEGQRMIADLNRASEVNVEPASRPEPAPTPEPEAAPEPAVTAENPRENWPGVAQVAQELMEEIDGDTDDPGIAELLVTTGQAEWVADPEVDDVYALKRTADGETLAIVYGAERDIEISAALYDQLDGMNIPEPEVDEQPVSERLERDMAMDDLLDNMASFISATEAAGYEESLEPFYDRVDKFRDDGDLERFVEGILDGFMGTFTDEINRDGGDFRQLREAFIDGYNKWAGAHYSLLPIGDDLLDDEIDVDSEPGAIGDALIDALDPFLRRLRADGLGGWADNLLERVSTAEDDRDFDAISQDVLDGFIGDFTKENERLRPFEDVVAYRALFSEGYNEWARKIGLPELPEEDDFAAPAPGEAPVARELDVPSNVTDLRTEPGVNQEDNIVAAFNDGTPAVLFTAMDENGEPMTYALTRAHDEVFTEDDGEQVPEGDPVVYYTDSGTTAYFKLDNFRDSIPEGALEALGEAPAAREPEPGVPGEAPAVDAGDIVNALEGIGDTIRPDDRGRGRAENMFWSRAAADISDAVEAINNGDNARAADLIDSAAANVDRYDTEQAGMVYNELTDIAQQLRDAAEVPTPEADFGPPPEPGDARTQLAETAQYAGFAPEDVEVISNSTSAAQRVMAVLNSPIYQGLKNSDEPLSRDDAELLQTLDDLMNAQVDLPEPELPSSVQWPPPGWTYPDYDGDNPSAVTDGRGFRITRDINGDYFLTDDRTTDPNYYGMYYSDLAEAIRDRDILSEMMAHDNRSRLAAAVEAADPDLANALRSEPSATRRLQMVRDSEKVQALLARADWARRPAIGGQRDAADRARVSRAINMLNTMLPRQRDITSDEYATHRDLPEHAMRDNPPAPDALPPQTPEAPAAEPMPTPTATPQGTEETRQKIISFKDRMYEYFSARGVFRRGDRNLNNALFALMDVRNALRDDNKDLYDRAVSRVSWLLERRLNARDLSQEWRDVIAEHEAAGAPTPTPTPEPEPVPAPTPEPEPESAPDVELDEDDGSPPDAVDIISQALREIGMDQVADTVDGYQAGRVSPEDAIQALRDALVWQIVDLADEDARVRLGGQVVDAINAINAVENNYADMPNVNPEPISEEDRAGMAVPNAAPPRPAGAAPENRRRYVPEGVVNDRNGQEIYAGRRVRARRDGLEGVVQRVQEDPAYARIKWDDGRVQVRSARQLEVIDVVAPAVAPEPALPTPEPALETPEAPAAPEMQSFDQMLQTARFDLVTVRGQLPNVARSLDERDRRNAGLALRDAIEAIDVMDFDEFDRASARAQYLLNRSRVDGDSDLAEQVVAVVERVRAARAQQAQAPQAPDSDLFSPEEWGPDAARPGDLAPIQPSPASWGVSRPLDGTTHPRAGNPNAAASDFKAWDDRAAEIAEAARSRASLQEFLDNPTEENAKNVFGADGTEFGNSGYRLTNLGVASWGRTVSISATIVDADNRRVGTVQRQLRKGRRPGEVEYAYNALMAIDNPDNRRTGFASAYNRWMENWYIANGIKEVHVEAALEDGALVWALNGFDFYDGDSGTRWDFANHLVRWGNRHATGPRERAQMAELTRRVEAAEAAGRPDMLPLPIHFAMVGFSPGKEEWFGQRLMLSLQRNYARGSWNGTKHLRPDAREYAASQAWARFSRGANKRVLRGENSAQVSPDFIDALSGLTWANDLGEHFDAVSGVLARSESLARLSPAAKRKLQVAVSNAKWNVPQGDDLPYDSYVHDLYKLSSALRKELAADYPQIDTGTLAAPLIAATYRDLEQGTVPGFNVKRLGRAREGVNTTFVAEHVDSGMVFYVKKDDTGLSAHNGVAAANELNADKVLAQLGFAGYGRYAENVHGRSPEDRRVRGGNADPNENIIIMPRVGDTVPLASRPVNGSELVSWDHGTLRDVADPDDIVRMFLFDLVTNNTDRHGGNWQAARDTNGLLHLFPIDHGLIKPIPPEDVEIHARGIHRTAHDVASNTIYSVGLRDYLRSLGRDQAEIIVSDIKQELHNAIVNATSRPGFINSEWWRAVPLEMVDSIDPGKIADIFAGGR